MIQPIYPKGRDKATMRAEKYCEKSLEAFSGIRLEISDMMVSVRRPIREMQHLARVVRRFRKPVSRAKYHLPELERRADTLYWQRRLH